MSKIVRFSVLFCWITKMALSAVFSNQIMGKPTVSCGPESIEILSNTEKDFEGVVYVKNWRRTSGCSRSFSTSKTKAPAYSVRLNELASCGIEMRRKPSDGTVEMLGVFVFSFHPTFVTLGDKAFAVHCVFKQYDVTVGTAFPLKELITKDTLIGVAQLPSVHMEVVNANSKSTAKTVKVGEPIVFKWTLPHTSDVYGLRVRDCTAETMRGQRVLVLEDGCSLDQTAISHITYAEDLSEAHASAQAFKFADADDMWFKCTVTVCNKFTSIGFSEDSCSNIKNCKNRGRRDAHMKMDQAIKRTIDDTLLEMRVLVLDSYNQHTITSTGLNKTSKVSKSRPSAGLNSWKICMRKPIFALLASFLMLMYGFIMVAGGLILLVFCTRRQSSVGKTEESCAKKEIWSSS